MRGLFDRFPADRSPYEAQTEDDLIRPELGMLCWSTVSDYFPPCFR